MGIAQGFVRFLLPRADYFYDYLEKQAKIAHDGALALAKFRGEVGPDAVRGPVQELEHEGDKLVHELEEALARTYVTPIDREDLHDLANTLDDIIDLMNGAARACVLLGVDRATETMVKLMDCLVSATEILAKRMPSLRQHKYADLLEAAREVNKIEKDADTIFREEISRLFHDRSIDARVLLQNKEILDDLENAVDSTDRVATRLKNLAVKHG